jgi:hypothetical protein
VAVIVLTPIAIHALWDYIEVRRLISEIGAIRGRGEPVTERDLGPTSPQSDEQKRASRFYLAAAALALDGAEQDRTIWRDLQAAGLRGDLPTGMRDNLMRRLEPRVATYAEAFPLLDRADALDFTALGPGTDHSYRTGSFWNLTRQNSSRAALRCLAGQTDEAVTGAKTTIRLKRVVRSSRAWLGFGRTTGQDWIVPFVLSHCPPSSAALESLARTLKEFEPGTLVQDLMAERVAFIGYVWPYYGIDARSPEHFNFKRWSPLEVVMRPWITHRLVREFRARAEAIAAARLPMRERKAALTALLQRSAQPHQPGPQPIAWMPASVFVEGESPRWADGSVMWSAFHTAVAIERYRRENGGRNPAALAALVPRYLTEIPTDPNSGSSLLYKPIEGGYTIYGVGPNGIDEGGDITPGNPKWPQGLPTESRDSGVTIRHHQ